MTDSAYRNPCDRGSSPSGARPLWKARGWFRGWSSRLVQSDRLGKMSPDAVLPMPCKSYPSSKAHVDGWRVNSKTARFQAGGTSRHCMSMGVYPPPGPTNAPALPSTGATPGALGPGPAKTGTVRDYCGGATPSLHQFSIATLIGSSPAHQTGKPVPPITIRASRSLSSTESRPPVWGTGASFRLTPHTINRSVSAGG